MAAIILDTASSISFQLFNEKLRRIKEPGVLLMMLLLLLLILIRTFTTTTTTEN